MLNPIDSVNQDITQAITKFSAYCKDIESIFHSSIECSSPFLHKEHIEVILNGGATSALQRLVPANIRKKSGIFFTNAYLADKVAKHIVPILRSGGTLLDPACGAGNLLVACSNYLPRGHTFLDTIQLWSQIVSGYDLFPEFIRASRLRLVLAAANHHMKDNNTLSDIDIENVFPHLKVGNVFDSESILQSQCIVVNPPFGYMQAPSDCTWAHGRIQAAGWFLEKLLLSAREGQHIVAILPDVLNSGTRYERWRNHILTLTSSLSINQVGRFDLDTDVDVFILHAVKGNKGPTRWPNMPQRYFNTNHHLSNFFNIHVGTIVPHRDILEGEQYPYIHARTAPKWETIDHLAEYRPSTHTVFMPPFVVVHRTSSPSDKYRCMAAIVNLKQKVAVENHLLVLLPKDKQLSSCKQAIDLLRSKKTNDWLNSRIRCRHLTVTVLRELPCFQIGIDPN
jgi:hypothetical protein